MIERVSRFWQSLGGSGLVVAVSGGPDSVALLRSLQTCGHGRLVPAHLNHMLRGEESDGDEAFCYSLGAICHRIDIAAIVRAEGGNLEAVARRERYAWLASVARAHGLAFLATGHTASDQAETVLHRVIRGTGLEGLRGIVPRRRLGDQVELVRPLLNVTRTEVLAYLASIGQASRHDTTNDNTRMTRARIRHELLPLLARDYNPRVEEVLGRLARQAEEWAAEEERAAEALLRKAERARDGVEIILDRSIIESSTRRLVRAALRLLWRREGWAMGGMGLEEWEAAAGVCLGEATARDLPGGLHIKRARSEVRVSPT